MRRQHFLFLAAAIALPARAQAVPRIGFLQAGDPEPSWSLFKKARGFVFPPMFLARVDVVIE